MLEKKEKVVPIKKGIVIENRAIEPFQVGNKPEDTADNFADLLMYCVNIPDQSKGFTPATMVDASKAYRHLEAVRGDSEINIPRKMFDLLVESFNRVQWGKILPGVVDLAEYLEGF